MVQIIHLDSDAPRPLIGEDQPWIYIEEADGLFFGTGGAWKASGEWVGYGSLSEDDVNLDRALRAADAWASRYNVPIIWVFASHDAGEANAI